MRAPLMSRRHAVPILGLVLALAACQTAPAPLPGSTKWTRQFGTAAFDAARAVAVDSAGQVVVAGDTEGALAGTPAGMLDAVARAYDREGALLWTHQFGTAADDQAFAVAVDAERQIVVAGRTYGVLGDATEGGADLFVRKLDAAGSPIWTTQFGLPGDDAARAVAVDASGNVLVGGEAERPEPFGFDAYLAKLSPDGLLLWSGPFGSTGGEDVLGIASDAALHVIAVGTTTGPLAAPAPGDSDGFVLKRTAFGDFSWSHIIDSGGYDVAAAVATDASGRVVVAGHTTGTLAGPNAGGFDGFVRVLRDTGGVAWTRQFGTTADDRIEGVAVDDDGRISVVGRTSGALDGANEGGLDAFVRVYDASGNHLWTRQFGTPGSERAYGVAVDGRRAVVVAGFTDGALAGPSAGGVDAFVRSFER